MKLKPLRCGLSSTSFFAPAAYIGSRSGCAPATSPTGVVTIFFEGRSIQFSVIRTTFVGSSTKSFSYAGTHTAIVDHETWGQAQALLGANTQGERRKGRVTKETRALHPARLRWPPTRSSVQMTRSLNTDYVCSLGEESQ